MQEILDARQRSDQTTYGWISRSSLTGHPAGLEVQRSFQRLLDGTSVRQQLAGTVSRSLRHKATVRPTQEFSMVAMRGTYATEYIGPTADARRIPKPAIWAAVAIPNLP